MGVTRAVPGISMPWPMPLDAPLLKTSPGTRVSQRDGAGTSVPRTRPRNSICWSMLS